MIFSWSIIRLFAIMKLVTVKPSVYIINSNSYRNKHTDTHLRIREFIILITTIFKIRMDPVKIKAQSVEAPRPHLSVSRTTVTHNFTFVFLDVILYFKNIVSA